MKITFIFIFNLEKYLKHWVDDEVKLFFRFIPSHTDCSICASALRGHKKKNPTMLGFWNWRRPVGINSPICRPGIFPWVVISHREAEQRVPKLSVHLLLCRRLQLCSSDFLAPSYQSYQPFPLWPPTVDQPSSDIFLNIKCCGWNFNLHWAHFKPSSLPPERWIR